MDTNLARLQSPPEADSFADTLLGGLGKTPKEIACKYFYDDTGSRLFDAICELPEYYQTRTEMALLTRHASEIAALMGCDVEILEFGAGSLRKVRILLDAAQTLTPTRRWIFPAIICRRWCAPWRRNIPPWCCGRW
jgi:L-histidine N-alpha-methyltransferase